MDLNLCSISHVNHIFLTLFSLYSCGFYCRLFKIFISLAPYRFSLCLRYSVRIYPPFSELYCYSYFRSFSQVFYAHLLFDFCASYSHAYITFCLLLLVFMFSAGTRNGSTHKGTTKYLRCLEVREKLLKVKRARQTFPC